MDNKNSKSDSYVVREAENIIENYLKDRELCDIQNYHELKQKYERLKILSISLLIACFLVTLLNVIF